MDLETRSVAVPEGGIGVNVVESAEGGSWSWGVANAKVYSHYTHPTRVHGSSVKNGDDVLRRSSLVAKGKTASATVKSAAPGNRAYYRFSN